MAKPPTGIAALYSSPPGTTGNGKGVETPQGKPSEIAMRARLLAGTLAAELIPEAIGTLAELMRSSSRDQVRRGAALDLINVATQQDVDDAVAGVEEQPTKLYVIDSAKAAEELRKRLEGKK